ncbi:ComF family protein [Thiomicrorhabdus sediminis]|uniref:ComF family protein n=1 Tax=Thiomicrorhabdus sediminis TaxID=2580412 RepID=A0A4P9K4X3_9GAMM|nr:ComF family protein [Thiomicrorhabdus sediminis]QCU89267.1 ComF family protein [Thiomicrorhabdus sediminis]
MPFHRVNRIALLLQAWLLGDVAMPQNSDSKLNLKLINSNEVCPVCCEPCLSGMRCGSCRFNPPSYDSTRVVACLNDDLSRSIHGFKYHEDLAYARVFADLMVEHIDFSGIEVLLPVPAHPLRRRQRGYNQAAELTRQLGKTLHIPVVSGALKRVKPTPSQTRLSRSQRERNLKGAFAVNMAQLAGCRSIALIDDVITTGATMQALAKQMKKAMPDIRIEALALAKTMK